MKIEDIAKLANVSKSAVSLAINGKPGVSEQTRQHILGIIEEHNYVPLRVSKTKQGQKNIKFIACMNQGIIDDSFSDMPFFNELLATLSIEASKRKYNLTIDSVNKEDISNTISSKECKDKNNATIVLATNLSEAIIEELVKINHHIIFIDNYYENIEANFVSINNTLGSYLATMHLIENGHTEIGYVQGKPRIKNFIERRRGFESAIKKMDLNCHNNHPLTLDGMAICIDPTTQLELQNIEQLPTAFVCENDYIAISLLKILKNLNIQVPKDTSIIGFDNIGECQVVSPELSTIKVHKDEIINQTLNIIDNQFNDNYNNIHVQINPQLVVRNSVIKNK